MFRKKQAITDLPLSDAATEAPHQVWDPIGAAAPPHAPPPDIPLDDPELREFIDAITAAKDADTEFSAITDGGLP